MWFQTVTGLLCCGFSRAATEGGAVNSEWETNAHIHSCLWHWNGRQLSITHWLLFLGQVFYLPGQLKMENLKPGAAFNSLFAKTGTCFPKIVSLLHNQNVLIFHNIVCFFVFFSCTQRNSWIVKHACTNDIANLETVITCLACRREAE